MIMGSLDDKRLIDTISDYIMKNNFENLIITDKSYSTASSVWGRICLLYNGKYVKSIALTIKTKYFKNHHKLKSRIDENLRNLKTLNGNNDGDLSEINLEVSSDEWSQLKLYISGSYRKKFRAGFTHFLAKKLQSEGGINCYLKCKHNWFRANNRGWNGYYCCLQCGKHFEASIDNFKHIPVIGVDNICTISVTYRGKITHDKICGKETFRGEKRGELRKDISAKGISVFRSEEIIKKNQNLDSRNDYIPSEAACKMMKSEFINRNKFSNDFFIDTEASKILFERLCVGNKIKGYIHEIIQNPFGLVMISEIQIKMWNQIQQTACIWYFDATSSIIKKVDKQQNVFLYSIVAHDTNKNVIVTIADFLTTCQTSINISKFLITIKHILNSNISSTRKNKPIAAMIITDHSFTLINSILHSFNSCTILEYLNYCYDLILNKSNSDTIEKFLVTKVCICATHFLKIILRKSKTECLSDDVRNCFIFSVTLLQNSKSLNEFERNLTHIYNLFMQPRFSASCWVSLNIISNELSNRNLHNQVDLSEIKNSEETFVKYKTISKNQVQNIKNQSPFSTYFQTFLTKLAVSIQNNPHYNVSSDPVNEFYNPGLFNIIYNRLYHIPMWTGIFVSKLTIIEKDTNINKSRITNNAVECYFKILKKNLLNYRLVMPSELCSALYRRLLAKYYQNYNTVDDELINPDDLDDNEERWSSRKNRKKAKTQYFTNKNDFGEFVKDYTKNISLIKNDEFFQSAFSKASTANNIDMIENNVELIFDKGNMDLSYLNLNNELNTLDINEIDEIYANIQGLSYEMLNAFFRHKSVLFDKIVGFLRSIKNNRLYQNQKLYPGYIKWLQHSENLKKSFVAAQVEGDGNCFYNSISMLIFGNAKFYKIIKIATASITLIYENLFKDILESTQTNLSFENILDNAVSEEKWASEYNIVAASILLDRPIYAFTDHTVHHNYTLNAEQSVHEPLCIIYVHSSHFMPLIPLNKFAKASTPQWNQFAKFFDPNGSFSN